MKEKTIVCISCYFKGSDFIDEMKNIGNKVILIASESTKNKNWPWHAIDEVYYMPEIEPSVWNLDDLIAGFSHLMKTTPVDAVVALDDYDVEKAALIRETFRIAGMGQTTQRYFRDKLAMRQMAKDCGIDVPEFCSIFNDQKIIEFTDNNPAPWVLKPRSEASATGIIKIKSKEQLQSVIASLGQKRHHFLLESFKPGDVFHVDSLIFKNQIVFVSASQYLAPPMEVSHDGGIFRTKTLAKDAAAFKDLERINQTIIRSFGLRSGVTHTEFIRGQDGKWYFLETSSRVGGANISDLVEAATGINLWREWAKIENACLKKSDYKIKESQQLFGGLMICLITEKEPNYQNFEQPEVYKILPMDYHFGIVFQAKEAERIELLLDETAQKLQTSHLIATPTKTNINS